MEENIFMSNLNKIFGIGLSRTGTLSLNDALGILGFKSIHYPPVDKMPELLERYDAATDTTVAINYKELDYRYPNSKFILTVRDIEDWLSSCKWFFSKEKALKSDRYKKKRVLLSKQQSLIRKYLYGAEFFNEESYREGYLLHLEDVKEYFKDRNDLLVMNIFKGDGFELLCPFLGVPTIERRFPHKHNRGKKVK